MATTVAAKMKMGTKTRTKAVRHRDGTEPLDDYTLSALDRWVETQGALIVAYKLEIGLATLYRARSRQPISSRRRRVIARGVAAYRGERWVKNAPPLWPYRDAVAP